MGMIFSDDRKTYCELCKAEVTDGDFHNDRNVVYIWEGKVAHKTCKPIEERFKVLEDRG